MDDGSCCLLDQISQLGNDIDGDSPYSRSGQVVSISNDGNTVAIGARNNDGINGTNSGHVRIYENINNNWTQLGQEIEGLEWYIFWLWRLPVVGSPLPFPSWPDETWLLRWTSVD